MLTKAPKVGELIESGLPETASETQLVKQSLLCLAVGGPVMVSELNAHLLEWLTRLKPWLGSGDAEVRSLAAACAVALFKSRPPAVANSFFR